MRRKFGKLINELATKDNKIVLLVGDIGYGIFDEFRKNHPKRFFNMGICEQSLIGTASGMALEGMKPWVYTITPFLIERPFEQIKLDINQQITNVKLIGYADYPNLGPTHKEINGKKLMSLFRNINSYFPKNSKETILAVNKSYKRKGPCFISLKKDKNIKILNNEIVKPYFSTNTQVQKTASNTSGNGDLTEQLKVLNELYKSGALTKEEFKN